MRMLQAFDGTICMVDDKDFDWAMQFVWYALKQGENHIYFLRKVKKNGRWTTMRLHRELLGLSDTRLVVDHKDKFTLNNCRGNLRAITQHQNTMNSRAEKPSKTSRYRGVAFEKARNKWAADIMVNFKRLALGRFDCEEDAARAYNEAALKHFGTFAQLNKVENETTETKHSPC